MALPEGYRPRVGDLVLILAAVAIDFDDGDKWVHLKPASAPKYSTGFTCAPGDLAQLVSRQWEEGMPVRNASDHSERGTVVTTFDEWVVVKPLPGLAGPWIWSNTEVEDDPPRALDPPPLPAPVPRETATEGDDDVHF